MGGHGFAKTVGMALIEFDLMPRVEQKMVQPTSRCHGEGESYAFQPLLVLSSGIVLLKKAPRAIFGGAQEFLCMERDQSPSCLGSGGVN